jgi:Tol biopolymer transport system component
MPALDAHGENIYVAVGEPDHATILKVHLPDGESETITPTTNAYFPVMRDDDALFYVQSRANDSQNDQIYLKLKDGPTQSLLFNDCRADNSDPTPVADRYVVFSSTSRNEKYELFMGDIITGRRWSLDDFGVNKNRRLSKLGADYWENLKSL